MKYIVYCGLALILTSCAPSFNEEAWVTNQQSQLQKRNYQSRRFDTNDKIKVMKAILSTLQDLGFIVKKSSESLGTISAVDFVGSSRLTVSVRAIGKQTIVRVSASRNEYEIKDPIVYQNFFSALSKSLFVEGFEADF